MLHVTLQGDTQAIFEAGNGLASKFGGTIKSSEENQVMVDITLYSSETELVIAKLRSRGIRVLKKIDPDTTEYPSDEDCKWGSF